MSKHGWTDDELSKYRRWKELKQDRQRRGVRGRSISAFDRAFFVAWDGEGQTLASGEHVYDYLGAGWYDDDDTWRYEYLSTPGQRLRLADIVAFMERIARATHAQAINVWFSATYDWTHILYDLQPDQAWYAMSNTPRRRGWSGDISVKYIPRHELSIKRGRKKDARFSSRHWDVFGFFQQSFVAAIENWLGADYSSLDVIRRGKSERGGLISDISAYNEAECRALVDIMRVLQRALSKADIVVKRWDGAGSIAAALFKRHMPRGWFETARMLQADEQLYEALCTAYFGGRIEMVQFGTYHGDVYKYDIRSAYPAAMVELPDLSNGRWVLVERPTQNVMEQFGVVYCEWEWDINARLTPLPYRSKNGNIYFPGKGRGWYHTVEVRAVMAAIGKGDGLHILRAYVFEPNDATKKPFGWVHNLYTLRRDLKRAGDSGGVEKAIKLGINSLYGRLAQQRGYRPARQTLKNPYGNGDEELIDNDTASIPPYYNAAAAGYITAACRAKLWRAAMQRPEAILTLATDGIYSTQALELELGDGLGEWEYTCYENATWLGVQPGFYFIRDQSGRWYAMTRGLPRTDRDWQRHVQNLVEKILHGWAYEQTEIVVEGKRMVSLKSALANRNLWPTRGGWVDVETNGRVGRILKIVDGSNKRLFDETDRLHERLVTSVPYAPVTVYAQEHSYPRQMIPHNAFIEALDDLDDEIDAYHDHA